MSTRSFEATDWSWHHEATEPQAYRHRDHCDDEASYALTRHEWQRHASCQSIVAGTDAPGTE